MVVPVPQIQELKVETVKDPRYKCPLENARLAHATDRTEHCPVFLVGYPLLASLPCALPMHVMFNDARLRPLQHHRAVVLRLSQSCSPWCTLVSPWILAIFSNTLVLAMQMRTSVLER